MIVRILFLIVIMFQVLPVLAQGASSQLFSWSSENSSNSNYSAEQEESDWANEYSESVYENYGSDDSPSYLNRENIDVYESNHGGDSYDLPN